MSDLDNLRTASAYLNNQLLSRGLLRDGQNINFDDPGDDDETLAETMGRIMAVLNDLILRRDRDAEHRESLAATLRTLRAENLRQTNDIQRLADKISEAQRKTHTAEAAEVTLRTQLRSVEATLRGLKEELARAKSMVNQTRTSCATELRRRDKQIDALKRQFGETNRTRGTGKTGAVTVISVTGEIGEEAPKGPSNAINSASPTDATSASALRNETNEFLADLAKDLRQENAAILGLITRTRDCLVEMTRWEKPEAVIPLSESVVATQLNCEELDGDLEGVLEHLRTILTNPSFVPIEEVEVREDEISRLREGWERMETRWREAVHLIDGWRRRMATSGRPINEEELKMGLRLSPVRVRHVSETYRASVDLGLGDDADEDPEDDDLHDSDHIMDSDSDHDIDEVERIPTPIPGKSSLQLVPAPTYDDEVMSGSDDEIYEDYDDNEGPNVEILQQSIAHIPVNPAAYDDVSYRPPTPACPSPLKEVPSAGNRQNEAVSKPIRKVVEFSEMIDEQEAPSHEDDDEESILPIKVPSKPIIKDSPTPGPTPALAIKPSAKAETVSKAAPTRKPETRATTKASATPAPSRTPATRPTTTTTTVKTRREAVSKHVRTKSSADSTDDSAKIAQARTRPRTPAPKPRRPISLIKNTPAPAATKTKDVGIIEDTKTAGTRGTRAPLSRQNSTKTPKPSTKTSSDRTGSKPISKAATDKAPNMEVEPEITPTENMPTEETQTKTLAPKNETKPNTEPTSRPESVAAFSETDSIRSFDSKNSGIIRPTPRKRRAGVNGTPCVGSPSRLPLPRDPGPQQSPITMATIAAKIAASEREADAARVRAKLKAARLAKTTTPKLVAPSLTSADLTTTSDSAQPANAETVVEEDPVKRCALAAPASARRKRKSNQFEEAVADDGDAIDASPMQQKHVLPRIKTRDRPPLSKRKRERRTSKVANRRRSTLTPLEFEVLVSSGSGAAVGAGSGAEAGVGSEA
ncbi:Afadin- and alpha -actinin-Binding protein [Ceratocystis lukuohia]|uniref:Afadin- and alpha -actinin-Binding protein n=1 Tax=Ceratocystis lukuohia TaxID=2019550 RepID=A0ABR4MGQ1_9PEZI